MLREVIGRDGCNEERCDGKGDDWKAGGDEKEDTQSM